MSHKKPRIEIDDDEYFTVPDLGWTHGAKLRSLSWTFEERRILS
jgi:hypothetical protein